MISPSSRFIFLFSLRSTNTSLFSGFEGGGETQVLSEPGAEKAFPTKVSHAAGAQSLFSSASARKNRFGGDVTEWKRRFLFEKKGYVYVQTIFLEKKNSYREYLATLNILSYTWVFLLSKNCFFLLRVTKLFFCENSNFRQPFFSTEKKSFLLPFIPCVWWPKTSKFAYIEIVSVLF